MWPVWLRLGKIVTRINMFLVTLSPKGSHLLLWSWADTVKITKYSYCLKLFKKSAFLFYSNLCFCYFLIQFLTACLSSVSPFQSQLIQGWDTYLWQWTTHLMDSEIKNTKQHMTGNYSTFKKFHLRVHQSVSLGVMSCV